MRTFTEPKEDKQYLVPVDQCGNYTPCKYRKVNEAELDSLLDKYGKKVLRMCSNGTQGAMTMWACFKSRIDGGCYHDMINSYCILTDDSKSLVDREHELRHAFAQYEELWRIRYHGTVENYYLERAKKAGEHYRRYTEVCDD